MLWPGGGCSWSPSPCQVQHLAHQHHPEVSHAALFFPWHKKPQLAKLRISIHVVFSPLITDCRLYQIRVLEFLWLPQSRTGQSHRGDGGDWRDWGGRHQGGRNSLWKTEPLGALQLRTVDHEGDPQWPQPANDTEPDLWISHLQLPLLCGEAKSSEVGRVEGKNFGGWKLCNQL